MFNWQGLNEGDFRKWMVVNLISADLQGDSFFEEISEATNKFQEVELSIKINGVEVPTDYFVAAIEKNMDFWVKKEAQRIIDELAPLEAVRAASDSIGELLESVQGHIRETMRGALEKHGIELPEQDY